MFQFLHGPLADLIRDLIRRQNSLSMLAASGTLSERERGELERVRNALERASRNEYDLCEVCESPIAHNRLRDNPLLSTCISCSRKMALAKRAG